MSWTHIGPGSHLLPSFTKTRPETWPMSLTKWESFTLDHPLRKSYPPLQTIMITPLPTTTTTAVRNQTMVIPTAKSSGAQAWESLRICIPIDIFSTVREMQDSFTPEKRRHFFIGFLTRGKTRSLKHLEFQSLAWHMGTISNTFFLYHHDFHFYLGTRNRDSFPRES